MAQNRINVLVSLEGADDNLRATIARAEQSLGSLAGSARTAGEKANAGLAQVQAGVASFSDQFGRAKTQLVAFLAAFEFAGKVQQLIEIADAWNMMNARLKLATAGQREFTSAQHELFAIAQRIGVPIAEVATLYGKLQQAIRMLGGEQKQAFQITESISQALRLSGASANEAQSALLQFGQALSSGVLRGEEFNSVVENSPRLAQALADGLNVPIGRLRKLAEEGQLTADVVVRALLSQKDKLAAEYAQLPVTVAQSFERLKNAFGLWVAKLDESTGFTKKLADALTWLSQNLDTVMKWLTIIKDVGLAVLIYRFLPALVTAWQVAGTAAVTAANATAASWAIANQSLATATATAGFLKTGFAVLAAFFVGWEIGTWLSEKFEIVRKAGIFMVQALETGIELMRYHWEVFAAIFTSDTIAAATQRHRERLTQMRQIFADMYKDAEQQGQVSTQVMNQAAGAAAEITRRLEAVRLGSQEAVGRSLEAVHQALEKLKSRLTEVEAAAAKANQTVNDSIAKIGESYKGLTAAIESSLQQQTAAVQARYEQEKQALEQSKASEQQLIVQSTQLLAQSIAEQILLLQKATADKQALLEQESTARLDAARRHGETEQERQNNVLRVENDILATKRQNLQAALTDYIAHITALNAEANRHLVEIKRIEEEKRALHQSTDERIRELQRSTMSDYQAYQDKMSQIAELQEKARTAMQQGEYAQAKQYAKEAAELASQTARAVKDGDKEVVTQKEAVQRAIDAIRTSEELTIKALDGEGRAHKQAADAATAARGQIEGALKTTQSQIDEISAKLKEGMKLTIDADLTRLNKALTDLDKALAEKTRLLPIKIDLEEAQKQLTQLEQQLKEGKTVLVNADVSKAEAALQKLSQYARETSEIELRVSTDKALSSVQNVQRQLSALSAIETQSRHQVQSNAGTVRAEIQSLNGVNTSSTHTITVRKVEANAAGGLVGMAATRLPSFATGGRVAAQADNRSFLPMEGGKVPGSGNTDSVARLLPAGSFVLRKAAVRKYGEGLLGTLAQGVRHFATGGFAGPILPATGVGKQAARNPDIAKLLKMIELGMQGMRDYVSSMLHTYGPSLSVDFGSKTLDRWGKLAERDRPYFEALQQRPALSADESAQLERAKGDWYTAMAQMKLFGVDLERQLIDWEAEQAARQSNAAASGERSGEKGGVRTLAGGGSISPGDTVPAMLTPGEFVIRKERVNQFGIGFFETINNLKLPAQAAWQQVRGYASGGAVGLANVAGRASQVLREQFDGRDLSTFVAEHLLAGMPRRALAVPGGAAAPARTIRVELAAGSQSVAATVDRQDEARLLQLLKQAQSRAL
jgi:tape measure domain-containing protein